MLLNGTMTKGRITKWLDSKAYGFVQSDIPGDKDVFFHRRAMFPSAWRPNIGERVEYEVETTVDGRQRAKRVVQIDRDDIPLPNSIFRSTGA